MDINPDKQNVDRVFSHVNYYFDFYQREYKWTRSQVSSLLEDIFYKFDTDYEKNKTLEPNDQNIENAYSWYYLNTYITNSEGGKLFIVDGQQRLTTLSLILLKLYHMCKTIKSPFEKWVEDKILGYSSKGVNFWIAEDDRSEIMEQIYKHDDVMLSKESMDISLLHMMENYNFISKSLNEKLTSQHKLDTFVLYLLKRIVLINLDIAQTDVPMVFEVINDRGERLRPHEILKGKLLGQIAKADVKSYDKIWDEKTKELMIDGKDIVDDFFRAYFKAKYTYTSYEGKKIDGDYHKIIYSYEFNEKLKLKNNPMKVKEFIKNEFSYYIDLYKKIRMKYMEDLHDEQPFVYFNNMTDQDSQIMLILASCSCNDDKEKEKICEISRLVDKMYVLLYLNKSYDSNDFNNITYSLNDVLKDAKINSYNKIFNDIIVKEINEKRNANVTTPFHYVYFKDVGYQDLKKTFMRYFFTRVDYFLSLGMRCNMHDTFPNYVRSYGVSTGYHIDHVLARNSENLSNFNNDEELFEKERNRLGGLFLLKGRDNQSSGHETYSEKLKTYVNTNYWNQTLIEDFYKSNLDFRDFSQESGLEFKPIQKFDRYALESRSRLLFEIVKKIWDNHKEQ